METLTYLATLLPLAVSSGINLYATILIAGLSIQFNWVHGVPEGLTVLGSWPVIAIAGFFFVIEALADKIPLFDQIWDLIHTIVRPLGAFFLGFAVLGQADPMIAVIAALLAGGIALTSHGGKAGARVAMNVMSPAENISNIVVSTLEDLTAGSLTYIALKYPFQASIIAVTILILLALIVPSLLRWAFFVAKGFFVWIKSLGQKLFKIQVVSDELPAEHLDQVRPKTPILTSVCKAQNVKKANGRSGYLVVFLDEVIFFYNSRMGQIKKWQVDLTKLTGISIRKGWLVDVMEIRYLDEKGRNKKSNFAFLKDKSPLAEQMVTQLKPG